jgi:hypothetical protein
MTTATKRSLSLGSLVMAVAERVQPSKTKTARIAVAAEKTTTAIAMEKGASLRGRRVERSLRPSLPRRP